MLSLGLTSWRRNAQADLPPNVAPSVAVLVPAGGATLTEGVAATISGTATDSDGSIASVNPKIDGESLGSAMLGVGTFTYSHVPTAAQIGARTITATATDDDGASTTSAGVAVTVRSAEAGIVASCAPDILLVAGIRGTQYLTGDPITAWDDATANNLDGSSADGPAVYTASGETFADFENTVDTGGQRITIPHAWLSAKSKFSIALVVQRTKLAQSGVLYSFDNFDVAARFQTDNTIRFYTNTGTPYGACAIDANLHLVEIDLDGDGADNAARLKVTIDGVEQLLTFSGTISNVTPALLAGAIGRQTNEASPAQMRIGMFCGKGGAVFDAAAKTALRAHAKTLFPSLPY